MPIATLNLQRSRTRRLGQTIPDAWHHQMIFGVGSGGHDADNDQNFQLPLDDTNFVKPRIYLTNPLESIDEEVILEQLCSPSELLVKRLDVLYRWRMGLEASTNEPDVMGACSDQRPSR